MVCPLVCLVSYSNNEPITRLLAKKIIRNLIIGRFLRMEKAI